MKSRKCPLAQEGQNVSAKAKNRRANDPPEREDNIVLRGIQAS